MNVNNGYGEITKDDILDILHNDVYRQVYQYFKQTGIKYLEVTDYKFQINSMRDILGDTLLTSKPRINNIFMPGGLCITRDARGVISNDAPMTTKDVKHTVKSQLHCTRTAIREIVWVTLYDMIINLMYTPEDQNTVWFHRSNILRNVSCLYNSEVRSKVTQMGKTLFAVHTGLGFSYKRAENLVAGRYVNWLGKEHMHKMYGVCGPKATAEAYNMYIKNTEMFDQHYHNPNLRNWVIAVMTAMYRDQSIRPPLYSAIIEEQDVYTDRDPERMKLFSSAVSPSLLRTVYDKYPQHVHAIVTAAHLANQTRLPSYTICRYMCYHPWLIDPDTVRYAILLETDKEHRRKSQHLKLGMVLKFHRTYKRGKPWPIEDIIAPEIEPLPF